MLFAFFFFTIKKFIVEINKIEATKIKIIFSIAIFKVSNQSTVWTKL